MSFQKKVIPAEAYVTIFSGSVWHFENVIPCLSAYHMHISVWHLLLMSYRTNLGCLFDNLGMTFPEKVIPITQIPYVFAIECHTYTLHLLHFILSHLRTDIILELDFFKFLHQNLLVTLFPVSYTHLTLPTIYSV